MEEKVMEQKNVERKVNVVEDLDGNKIVVIHIAEDHKLYLYDIMKIKKEMSTHFQSKDLTQ